MKSLVHEASTIAKAIDQAWHLAGCPERFTVKVLEQPERNFFGFTTRSAKIALLYEELTGSNMREQRDSRHPRKDDTRSGARDERMSRPSHGRTHEHPRRDEQRATTSPRSHVRREEEPRTVTRDTRPEAESRDQHRTREQRFERPQRTEEASDEVRVERTPRHEQRTPRHSSERSERPVRADREMRVSPHTLSQEIPAHAASTVSAPADISDASSAHTSVSKHTSTARPAAQPAGLAVDVLWNDQTHAFTRQWIRETLATMGHAHPEETYRLSIDGTTLVISVPFHVFDESSRERQLFHSLGVLLLESLKKEFRKQFRGHKIVITYVQPTAA